jgi:hypothetical protein
MLFWGDHRCCFLRSKDEVKTKLEHVRSERCCLYAQSRTLGTEGGQLTAFWQVVEQQAKGQGRANPPFSIIGTNKQKIPQPKDRGGRSCVCSALALFWGRDRSDIFVYGLSDVVQPHHISGRICCV